MSLHALQYKKPCLFLLVLALSQLTLLVLADVLAYLLELTMELDIDLATAFADKMVKNNQKYPKDRTHTF